MKDKSVNKIKKKHFCVGCGTCYSVCPNEAIKINRLQSKQYYQPNIDNNLCNNCGICLKSCPAIGIDYNEQNMGALTSGANLKTKLFGNHLACFIGYTNDCYLRYDASSGGIATQLLIYALENKLIDGVLTTRMNREDPLEPEPIIAKTKEEITEASKSKYCPVPLNVLLKKIAETDIKERFAIVGLPCHIDALRKAEKVNKNLKNKIILSVAIFCSGTPSFFATDFLLYKLNINRKDIKMLNYRGDGWPGNLYIKLRDKSEVKIPYPEYWNFFGNLFYNDYCLICTKWFGKSADISVGDAWLPKITKKDKIGSSVIVSRTELGLELLKQIERKNLLTLIDCSPKEIIQSQKGFEKKRERLSLLIKLYKNRIEFPDLSSLKYYALPISLREALLCTIPHLLSPISSRPRLWYCLKIYCKAIDFSLKICKKF